MALFGFLLEFTTNLVSFFTGWKEKQIGRQEQQNADDKSIIQKLEAEKAAAASRPSAVDDLFSNRF